MLKLETDRLTFIRYEEHHYPFVLSLVTNPTVMRFIGNGQVKDKVYAKELIRRMQEQYQNFDDYGLHLLVHKETKAFIGHAGIVAQIIDDCFELELGYWIDPDYWRMGYGKEAANALKRYADEELELERYVSAIQEGNVASQKIALSNDMHLEKSITMEGKTVLIYVKENYFPHHFE